MNHANIGPYRLESQHILQADFPTAETTVQWMGAMQAQDYTGALWSVALRTPHLTQADIVQAVSDRKIIRTWPMRGTLHFIAAKDARWIISLLAPRATALAASRRRDLGIDEAVITKTRGILENLLSDDKCLTRNDICATLDAKGIATASQRGIHLLRYFSEQGLLCFGPHEGKQPTFVLMDEWIAPTKEIGRDEALAELTRRYFTSHGPATIQDFAGWAHLTLTDVKRGLAMTKDMLAQEDINGKTYWFHPTKTTSLVNSDQAFLLPGFDEYMLGYKDRSATLEAVHAQKIVPGNNGVFLPTIIIGGQVKGTWKRIVRKDTLEIHLLPFTTLSTHEVEATSVAAQRYGTYIEMPVRLTT